VAASYDSKGNMTAGFDGSTYTYDAQNRLLSATKPPALSPVTINYDGLNRAVKRLNNRAVQPVSAVSRMTHGSAGTFDVLLPLSGTPGIECRSQGGNFQIVVTFSSAVSYTGATVTNGTGSISSTSLSSDHAQVTINLTSVANAQTIVVTLSGVSDGAVINDVPVAMGVLLGDTTGNGSVNSSDLAQTQSQSGQLVSAANFREDVTADGAINSSDIAVVQAQSGIALGSFTQTPPTPGPTYCVYDGWNLLGEYAPGAASPSSAYLAGAGGLVKNLVSAVYYYQDASGSTSHLADSAENLLESYRYDLQGTPFFYNASNTLILASAYGVRHLFTGQQWYSDLGLYDLRNRFYSPDIGRFLQADPASFNGDVSNLYRYCENNPLNLADPTGLYVKMYGIQANASFSNQIVGSFQVGYSANGWNPLSWTVGAMASYTLFTSATTYQGVGATALETTSPFASSIRDIAGPSNTAGGAWSPTLVPSFLQLSGDVNVYDLGKSPLTITAGLTLGTPGDRLGINVFTHSENPWVWEMSVSDILSAIANLFSSATSNPRGLNFGGSVTGLSAYGSGAGISFWEAGAGTFYNGVTIPDDPNMGAITLPDAVWAGSGIPLTGLGDDSGIWSTPGGSGACPDTDPECNKKQQ
jgi:RHS repeat-associated protein